MTEPLDAARGYAEKMMQAALDKERAAQTDLSDAEAQVAHRQKRRRHERVRVRALLRRFQADGHDLTDYTFSDGTPVQAAPGEGGEGQ